MIKFPILTYVHQNITQIRKDKLWTMISTTHTIIHVLFIGKIYLNKYSNIKIDSQLTIQEN